MAPCSMFNPEFDRCVSVWMLWLLKLDFSLSFASLIMQHSMLTSKPVTEMPEVFIQHSNKAEAGCDHST